MGNQYTVTTAHLAGDAVIEVVDKDGNSYVSEVDQADARISAETVVMMGFFRGQVLIVDPEDIDVVRIRRKRPVDKEAA